MYGEFVFLHNNLPCYSYKCFDAHGNDKEEIKNIKNIEKFLVKEIEMNTGLKVKGLSHAPFQFIKIKDIGIKEFELNEIVKISG